MLGCLKKLGCAFVMFFVFLAGVWFSRDYWMPKAGLSPSRATATAQWQSAGPKNADRADANIERMQFKNGPAYVNVTADDFLAYVLVATGTTLPPGTDSLQASIIGDRVYVRARTSTALVKENLGFLGRALGDRERIMLGGTVRVIKPGLSEFAVKEAVVGPVRVPTSMIPMLLRQTGTQRPPEVAADGVPLATPKYIGDVRVANGRITVYKKQP